MGIAGIRRAPSPVRLTAAAGLAVALVWAALAGSVERAGGAFPGKDGRIAFHRTLSNKKGGFADRILTVKKNGEKLKAITQRCCKLAEEPTWSPNGRRIAFTLDRRIFTMNRKGRKREQVTKGKRFEGRKFEDTSLSWSPDGTEIAFSREYRNFTMDLLVVDSDGSNLREIETSDLDPFDPAWSPNGEWIAFVADSLGPQPQGIYRMRPDGGDLQLVLALGDLRSGLDWSPNGELLAYSTRSGGTGPEIHTVRPDGSEDTTLTDQRKPAFDPAFSPSGRRIVFTAGGVLKRMAPDGDNVEKLLRKTRGRGDFSPSWQPK